MEINLTEFRIGNLVKTQAGAICKIAKLQNEEKENQIRAWGINNSPFGTDDPSSIPISGKLLLHMGFIENINNYHLDNVRVWIDPTDNRCFFFMKEENSDTHLSIAMRKEIKYIHQLQNLYYAITDKELKLK